MKKIFPLFIGILLLPSSPLFSQVSADPEGNNLPALSPQDQFILSRIPELTIPEIYKGSNAPLIPFSVDNSTQPYFRPITSQTGYECGQSAGIAFNFTYEVDRLRNLPANVAANQYPTHFTWDFLNQGNNYVGASAFDSWEIVRTCGNMNVADYGGGLGTGGYLRWISGYDVYYNGMANRLNYVRGIRVDSPEGLQNLKYWLYDHLEGAAVGGVANIYGQYFTPTKQLPSGTPEAGKWVQTAWGASPSHTWTVCGYNDSIRYDYNGDGQYTNNIDITGDGQVDMHDWEIGGLKFANGYAGTGWGNSGFCYLMYKTLADNIGYGGIWNHHVYVIDVKETCSPQLTMKVTLKHTSRNKILVTAGISTDLSATAPSYVLEFPIFKYQGGDHYMQGGTTENDKTIEFGLDLAPLLNQISSGTAAKYFLQVQEADPGGTATGEIVSYSLVDYTSGSAVTIPCGSTNVPVANNTITRLSITHTVNFVRPVITTTSLPPATLYQPYSYQLAAASGTTPYLWDVKMDYPESTTSATFPSVTDEQLTVTNINTGYAVKTLGFSFPFYNKSVSKLYIYVDGYILFDDQPFTWPYLVDKMLLFKSTNIISPFMYDLYLYSSQSDGIWYKEDATSATIRWKASISGQSGSTSLNIAVKLYKDGKIEFYYGNMNYPAGIAWTGGISGGDNRNYQFSLLNGASSIAANTLDAFTACGFPVEMSLSETGLFTGTPQNVYTNRPINFRVTDNNNLTSTKTLLFNTNGLLLTYSIISGGDSIIEFGETASVNLTIQNVGSQVNHNVTTMLTGSNAYITLTDSTESFGDIGAGQTVTVNNAFTFTVSPSVPDNFAFEMILHVTSTEQDFDRPIDLTAYAPIIQTGPVTLLDGDNGRLDPGETTDIIVSFRNDGGAKANNLNALFTSLDPFLIVNSGSASLGTLYPDSSKTAVMNISATGDAPFQHLYLMNSNLTANNGFNTNDTVYLFSGEIIEDFETGNFTKFLWQFGGFNMWYIDEQDKYEGSYSARSGYITDNQESVMYLSVKVLASGPISFWKKVSCENDPSGTNYDFLAFYIDNTEMGRWDGIINWSKETFNVTEGYHTFKWIYHKDYSVSSGSDCAWVDFISFPVFEGALPVINASPSSFEKSLYLGQTASDVITVTNTGGNFLEFSVIVFDTAENKKIQGPLNVNGSYIECFSEGFVPGQAINWTFALHHMGSDNEYIKHVKMDFPPGVIVSSATNFSGGSLGDLVFQGTPGNGPSLNWHGESGSGRGVVKTGETAFATVTGSVEESYMDDAFIVYSIRGDSIGSVPHDIPGYVKLTNFSLPNTWLSLSGNWGTLGYLQSAPVAVGFSAQDMEVRDYACNIIARDSYNNKIIIPVLMHVLDTATIGLNENSNSLFRIRCFPNPFRYSTCIQYFLQDPAGVSMEIYGMTGIRVKTVTTVFQDRGTHRVIWNGNNDGGEPLPAGIYNVVIRSGNETGQARVILVR